MEDAKLLSLHKKLKESAPKGRKGGLGLGKRDDNLGFRISLPKDHPMYKKGAEDNEEADTNETPRTKRKRILYSNFVKAGTKVVNEVETYNTRKTFSDSEDEDDSKKQKKKKKKTTKTKKKGKKRKNNETTREPSVVSDEAKQVQKYKKRYKKARKAWESDKTNKTLKRKYLKAKKKYRSVKG